MTEVLLSPEKERLRLKNRGRVMAIAWVMLISVMPGRAVPAEPPPVFPTPQFYRLDQGELLLNKTQPQIEFLLPRRRHPAVEVAKELISSRMRDLGLQPERPKPSAGSPTLKIVMLSFSESAQRRLDFDLVEDDRRLLSGPERTGQEYVLVVKPADRTILLIGQQEQGILHAAASLVQLMTTSQDTLRIPAIHIRDFPDFRYRMAADWLLNVEINRWSYDWGDGIQGYTARLRRKLDLCTRYKINMVLAHGFGWGTDFFPGFADMMKDLNRYARDRGIKLVTGGYGASYGIAYQSGPLYEAAPYLGQVFTNRESYPNGKVYQCMGFSYSKTPSIDTRTLGSCRANEPLNDLKAAELKNYVARTEPGGFYIHHEDFGGFEGSQRSWLQRCERCRKRWPSDDLKAVQGGAGGLAAGYRTLIETVQSVRNPQSGYDAARDCTIILVSPVYDADPTSQEDWENVLELWQNIGRQLPKSPNVEICFREIFPLKGSNRQWTSDFNKTMSQAGLPFKIFLFFAGGGNYYLSDYPVVASPAMNRSFLGSEGIYNGSSGFNQEPLQLINAEYSWNTRSNGFFQEPRSYDEALGLWRGYQTNEARPAALFEAGGTLERVCDWLYGPRAGRHLAEMQRNFLAANDNETPPGMWQKLYPLSVLWRNLAVDSAGWTNDIQEPTLKKFLSEKGLSPEAYHSNLESRWMKWAAITEQGIEHLKAALGESDLRPESRPDLEHQLRCLEVGVRFSRLLAGLHSWFASGDNRDGTVAALSAGISSLESYIHRSFQIDVIDPSGGEIPSWLAALKKIRARLNPSEKSSVEKRKPALERAPIRRARS
ncbi:MAG: glycoside hydrolase family 20 zincin-like fold domain-containing protein [Acidobacteriota bacterium]